MKVVALIVVAVVFAQVNCYSIINLLTDFT